MKKSKESNEDDLAEIFQEHKKLLEEKDELIAKVDLNPDPPP